MGRVSAGLRLVIAPLRARLWNGDVRRECICFGLLLASIVTIASSVSAQNSQTAVFPSGMAYDTDGNLFIADAARNQIVRVSVGGELSVVAGSGVQGFTGDGGPAIGAMLDGPQSVAVTADGTLFIADTGNRRIRAVAKGSITTVAGTGQRGDTGDGSTATAAMFQRPTALAISAGGVLVCDSGSHRVRLLSNGIMQAFAGNGVQGFGGDGGPATNAQLDTPAGVAVLPDARVVIADSHNQRLRVVGSDGVISTLAGTGTRGYSGDGGPAAAAMLALPRGVSTTGAGTTIFADSNNQRVRMIDASGNITTLAGSGAQGSSGDATAASTASLNVPRALAVSPYGAAAFGDRATQSLKAVAVNGEVYLVPAPAARTSSIAVSVPTPVIYGQASAKVMVTAAVPAQGMVEVDDAGSAAGAGALSSGSLNLALSGLPAGNHTLVAQYKGDGVNPAAFSSPATLIVTPASATVTANPVTTAYGEAFPAFSGSVGGILPQDAGKVAVMYSSAATPLSDVGSYAIEARLTGLSSANYVLDSGTASGTLKIEQAKSATAMQTVSQASYAGLPLQLVATVSPQYAGTPTGEIAFVENGSAIGRATIKGGAASATYLSPSTGTHVITATYQGDKNFLGSSSVVQSITVAAMPDFAVSSSTSSQTVQAGLAASFLLNVASQGSPFTGSVTFSMSGLPTGAQATFTPAVVVPGASGAATTLSIQTPTLRATSRRYRELGWLAFLPVVFCWRRRAATKLVASALCCVLLLTLSGCGARTVGGSGIVSSQSYPLQITATSTNLAGQLVTHITSVTLTVQ